MKYFIGNWKMFGIPKSLRILDRINSFYSKDVNRNNYKVIITPPYTLIDSFSKYFKKKKSKNWITKLLSKRSILIEYCCNKFLHVKESWC